MGYSSIESEGPTNTSLHSTELSSAVVPIYEPRSVRLSTCLSLLPFSLLPLLLTITYMRIKRFYITIGAIVLFDCPDVWIYGFGAAKAA